MIFTEVYRLFSLHVMHKSWLLIGRDKSKKIEITQIVLIGIGAR